MISTAGWKQPSSIKTLRTGLLDSMRNSRMLEKKMAKTTLVEKNARGTSYKLRQM